MLACSLQHTVAPLQTLPPPQDEHLDYTMIAVRKDELLSLLGREVEPLKWARLELNRKDALYIMHHPLLKDDEQPKCFNCYLVQNTQGGHWTHVDAC